MKRSGVADLRLHPGRAPRWLLKRMQPMADSLFQVMVDEHGPGECLRRIGDPLWFQALSNVLGFDWDSSGTTTVLCGVLRSVLTPEEHRLAVAGGKGARSRRTPAELLSLTNKLGLGDQLGNDLVYASRMAAKVDSAALQDGFELYHHTIFFDTEEGNWAIVQQGMNDETRTSRRYHWISEDLSGFIEEPHSGLISNHKQKQVLDLTARISRECRKTCVDIACNERPLRLRHQFKTLKLMPAYQQTSLMRWAPHSQGWDRKDEVSYHRVFPERMDWQAVKRIYDIHPSNFEELLAIQGVGRSTVRGLALLSEIVHGQSPSWQDPVRMTFAFGGKDGVPFPVNRRAYDEAIAFLEDALHRAKIGQKEKLKAFQRLRKYLPSSPRVH